jgi:hypothetical protein
LELDLRALRPGSRRPPEQFVSFGLGDLSGRVGKTPLTSGGPLLGTLLGALPLLDEAHGMTERHGVEGRAVINQFFEGFL